MIKLDRMELGDCFTPDELAQEIYRQCPYLAPPIPVKEIAKAVGITAVEPRDMGSIGGMLLADDGKESGVILYDPSCILGRQRFTIGHELGHFLLMHHNSEQQCSNQDIKIGQDKSKNKELEDEANRFSEALLMPDNLVSEALVGKKPSLELLQNISNRFQMSFEAMANKCSKLSEEPFALIYSKDGIVNYCWKNRDNFMYHIPLRRGDQMPIDSLAVTQTQSKMTISEVNSVPSNRWIGPEYPFVRCLEQVFNQERGFKVTMIQVRSD